MNTSSITARTGSTADSVSTTKTKRYHPLLVALHWLIAILIFGAFFLAQGNEGDRERFRLRQGNFPQQGFQQQGTLPFQGGDDDEAPPANFQPQIQSGNQAQQRFPQGGFP